MATEKKYRNGSARISARLDDIRTWLAAGDNLRVIYDRLKDELGMGYRGFCKHIQNRGLRSTTPIEHQKGKGQSEHQEKPSNLISGSPQESNVIGGGKRRFHHPIANEDDLI